MSQVVGAHISKVSVHCINNSLSAGFLCWKPLQTVWAMIRPKKNIRASCHLNLIHTLFHLHS